MPATITVTGTIGPGNTLTAAVFARVTSFRVDTETNLLTFVQDNITKEVSITAAATVTATKSGTTWTLTIS